jgi:N-acetylglutamate synthase/N-acetylornithine aminotransferase
MVSCLVPSLRTPCKLPLCLTHDWAGILRVASAAAAVFTQNRFQAAPVVVSREQLARHPGGISTVLVNSGCANACTGERGVADARATLDRLAGAGLGQGLLMSTGTYPTRSHTDTHTESTLVLCIGRGW